MRKFKNNIDLDDKYLNITPENADLLNSQLYSINIFNRNYIFHNETTMLKNQYNVWKYTIANKFKELVQFLDLFLKEKLFVNLFSSNWWGYNSKYRDTFNLENYAIYRLLCSFTDRFRNNSKYIFFINQWINIHKQYTLAVFVTLQDYHL